MARDAAPRRRRRCVMNAQEKNIVARNVRAKKAAATTLR
jgi:hypothetical protein